MNGASLTELQLAGSGTSVNVAEGYPRQRLTATQRAIVERFPEFLHESQRTGFGELESRAHEAFFGALGQHAAPVGSGRILSFPSSSQAIDVAARCISEVATTVAVVSPTLDCIPALLRARGLELVAVSEHALASPDPLAGLPAGVGALFIANPNNPTGTHLSEPELASLASACERRGVILVIDQCFRAFDSRTQYDAYAALDAAGTEYVLIEDTGKLWPMSGIKLGLLCSSIGSRLRLAEATADVLLTASPFVTRVVEELALDMASGGLAEIHRLVAGNRALVAAALEGCGRATVADGTSRVSVSRIAVEDGGAMRLWARLLRRGIHAVPCGPFYWADPDAGDRYVRIALSRDPEDVRAAAAAARDLIDEMVTA